MSASRRLPPGPRGVPFLGHLLPFRRDPIGFLTRLARDYGDVVRFKIGGRNFVQISDPDLIRDVLVTNHRNFKKTGFLERVRPVLGDGLVTADGELHRRQRRLMQPTLSRQRVAKYSSVIVDSAEQHAHGWHADQTVDMFQEMLRLTLRIVTRTLFCNDLGAQSESIERSLTTVINHITWLISPMSSFLARFPLPANRRFQLAIEQLDSVVYGMIEERRRSGDDHGDVLSMLLMAKDLDGDGSGMSDKQIRDEAMTLFLAGHETVATALTWTWYALAKNPDVYDRLCEEIDRVLAGRQPVAEDVPSLAYVEMVFAEAMRVFPPVWAITRLTVEDCELGGYHIPAGTVIGLSQYVVQHDPRFFDDPERFDPLRWTAERKSARHRYSYFPFGGGPRLCIGEPFAWLEGVLVLSTLCRQWRPVLTREETVKFHPTITLRPFNGMSVRLESRRPSVPSGLAQVEANAPSRLHRDTDGPAGNHSAIPAHEGPNL